MGWIRQQQ